MSATVFGGETKYTKRYNLGRLLSGLTRHFLVMSKLRTLRFNMLCSVPRRLIIVSLIVVVSLNSDVVSADGQTLDPDAVLAAAALSEEAKLTTDAPAPGAMFGLSIAAQGDTLIVGAPGTGWPYRPGAAYVFVRTDSHQWVLQQRLTAGDAGFGGSVALSGDAAVVGGTYAFGPNERAAYVFRRLNGVWTEEAKLTTSLGDPDDSFGTAVAISGDTVLVGAPRTASFSGVVYVFARSGVGWAEQQTLIPAVSVLSDEFGWSLALDGETAVIGAPHRTAAAHVFVQRAGIWVEETKLTASDNAGRLGGFGFSVALNGETILVGAPRSGSAYVGAQSTAYVFTRGVSGWQESAKLTADVGEAMFGLRVALDGETAVLGVPQRGCCNQGSAIVFRKGGAAWTAIADLVAARPRNGDELGGAVAVTGHQVFAGAMYHDVGTDQNQGAAYVFGIPGAEPLPGPPTLTGSVNAATVTLAWAPSQLGGTPTSYIVQAGTAPGLSNLFNSEVGFTTTVTAPVASGTYHVRVLAVNTTGASVPSNQVALVVGAAVVPGQPAVTSATAADGVLTVSWLPGLGAAATSYRLDFYSGATPVATVHGDATSAIRVPLPPGAEGAFAVRVTPLNGAAAGPSSSLFPFTIPRCVPPASPDVSGGVVAGTASIAWPAVPGATFYLLEAGTAPGRGEYVPLTNIGANTGAAASAVPFGFTAWVRIVAVNVCGQHSAPRDFLVR